MTDTQALPKPKFNGEVTGEIVAYAIEAANRARAAGGADPIPTEKLPYSEEVGNAEHCVLAKLFNFECTVRPSSGDDAEGRGWYAIIPDDSKDAALALAEALDTEAVGRGYGVLGYGYRVNLPEEVGIIAWTFDQMALPLECVAVPEGADTDHLRG